MGKRFGSKKVALVGAGAIGCLSARGLAGEGIALTVIDRDYVDSSNIGRQLLYSEQDVGMPKALAVKKRIKGKVKAVVADLDFKNIDSLLKGHSLVLDCTDNMEARFLINDYCKKNQIPWIYSAALRNTASLFTIMPQGPCFRCIFDRHNSLETCDTAGVSQGVVAEISAIQTNEAVNILLNNAPAEKGMIRINDRKIFKIRAAKNSNCPACNGNYEYLSGKRGSKTVKMCGSNSFQISGRKVSLRQLVKSLEKKGIAVKNFGSCIFVDNMTLFADGRAIIKAPSKALAKSKYHQILG